MSISRTALHRRVTSVLTRRTKRAALGGEEMFNPDRRHDLVQMLVVPEKRNAIREAVDADYTPGLNTTLGLDAEGQPPAGATFVSRTMPAGVTVRHYDPREATVDVWCSGLPGLTGKGAAHPILAATSWFPQSLTLR